MFHGFETDLQMLILYKRETGKYRGHNHSKYISHLILIKYILYTDFNHFNAVQHLTQRQYAFWSRKVLSI